MKDVEGIHAVSYPRGYARIDLDAMEENIANMRRNMSQEAQMMLVIKADGYGHGANYIAETFEKISYIWGFGVATLEEGIALRKHGIKKPILVLGCIFPNEYKVAIDGDIRFNVYNLNMAQDIANVGHELGKSAMVHIKIDTGMSRLGFATNGQSIEEIREINGLSGIEIEGVFTHFAKADEENKVATMKQFDLFAGFIKGLEKEGVTFAYKHCSNSAGIIDHPEYHMDLVRAGISLYGLYPSQEVVKEQVELKPVMSWHSSVIFTKEVPSGTQVSYGGTYIAKGPMTVATIPIGYADGYPRGLSGKGYVLINGKKAPILGRVCMDQFMVDITDVQNVEFMTPVVLIGKSGDEVITVEELGDIAGKFNYEFVCGIGKRIPRIYIKNGVVLDQ